MSFQRILVATDFSENAQHALDVVKQMLDAQGGRVVLMTALEAPSEHTLVGGSIKPLVNLVEARATAEARHRAEAERAGSGQARERVLITHHPPPDAIVTAARAAGADLIVVGSHGYRGFKRWVIGSVSERVCRQTTIPVLLIPPAGAPAGE